MRSWAVEVEPTTCEQCGDPIHVGDNVYEVDANLVHEECIGDYIRLHRWPLVAADHAANCVACSEAIDEKDPVYETDDGYVHLECIREFAEEFYICRQADYEDVYQE